MSNTVGAATSAIYGIYMLIIKGLTNCQLML